MLVDLNNLNLTIDQFNAAASGKYNIGQLKLSEDGTGVYRTNNHKTWTIFNNTPILPEESLALKNAFCKALEKAGLSTDDISEVKEKLGITDSAIDLIKAGSIKPLSAADVREIIDEYADVINAHRDIGAARLETSDDIYKGVSEETKKSRAATREAINTQTVDNIESKVNETVNTFLDILQFAGEGETDLNINQKGIAGDICGILKTHRNLPSKEGIPIQLKTADAILYQDDNAKVVVAFALDNGNIFPINTGMDRKQLLAQMDKVWNFKPGDSGETESATGETERTSVRTESTTGETESATGETESATGETESVTGETESVTGKKESVAEKKMKHAREVKDQYPGLSLNQIVIIEDLKDAFDLLDPKDTSRLDKQVNDLKGSFIEKEIKKYVKATRELKIDASSDKRPMTPEEFVADKKFQGIMTAKAKSSINKAVFDNTIEPLLLELKRVRGLDDRNFAILNKVREALIGGNVDKDKLIDEIKLAFTTKVTNSVDNVMEKINSGMEKINSGDSDDLDKNLNINDWLSK